MAKKTLKLMEYKTFSLEEKFQVLNKMGAFHQKPTTYSKNVTDHYSDFGDNWMFSMDIKDGARLVQVNRKTNTVPVEFIWGSPAKDPIEAMHECLNKCIEFHVTLIEGEEFLKSLEEKNELEKESETQTEQSFYDDPELYGYDPID
ncbi:hypothetical protein HN803_05005 [candidate division WWE3 bacterium]|jgi:hypothetical protein|nr:hypothetical protein [candidate division WWE3 bacterium]